MATSRTITASSRMASALSLAARAVWITSAQRVSTPGVSHSHRAEYELPRVIGDTTRASVQVLLEPREDLLPPVERGGLTELRAVDGEERVARVLVGVEFVRLSRLPERGLGLDGVVR